MTNKTLSNEAMEMIAKRFKVLSEPLRLRILHTLQDGEKSVNQLSEAVGASQPNVSKHLKILQEAGILRREQSGNEVFYKIVDQSIFDLCELVCNALQERVETQARVLAFN